MLKSKSTRSIIVAALGVVLGLFLGCSGGGNSQIIPPNPTSYPNAPYGLCFGPHVDGSDPRLGHRVTVKLASDLLDTIKPFVKAVRTYNSLPLLDGTESMASLARTKGFYVIAGCDLSDNLEKNERQIEYLLLEIRKKNVDLAVLGSEILLRKDLSKSQLIAYIKRVKATGVKVALADSDYEIRNAPDVVAEVDVLLLHIYRFWLGDSIEIAFRNFLANFNLTREMYPTKEIMMGEIGWPSSGDAPGNAVPNMANALNYLENILGWSNKTGVKCLYFEAFDEPWKVSEGTFGDHWGLWTKEMAPKPGVIDVFKKEPVFVPEVTPTINLADAEFAEGYADNAVNILVKLDKPTSSIVSVSYATSDLTAKAGVEYLAATGKITFLPGTTEKSISVTLKGNLIADVDKQFKVTILNPVSGVLGKSQATILIKNDDKPLGMEITYWPKIGETKNLTGVCYGLKPSEYRLAVYIKVGGGWWTKPEWVNPTTQVQPNGSWTCDITTGGTDASATEIWVFLIRSSYTPPLASGGLLPQGVIDNAVLKEYKDRRIL